ncbi:MAG: glycosyltransferase family 4 protein [Anaerolineae bacterium]|nr:glycosyltransferase family 4 protein [Anaerolineae bacterium]
MKIVYLSNSYVPSRRANSIQVMKMCQAMSDCGNDVTLITKLCPPRQESGVTDDYYFYSVSPRFEIVKLPRPKTRGGGLRYSAAIFSFLLRQKDTIDLLYCRSLFGAWCGTRLKLPTILEMHGLITGKWALYLYPQIITADSFKRLVLISDGLKKDLQESNLLFARDTVVAHDGANPQNGNVVNETIVQTTPARLKLGYVGHLYPGKGMEIVYELAHRLPAVDFHVVGGTEQDVLRWQQKPLPDNLFFHGFVPQSELSRYYHQFDVLLLPPQRDVRGATGQSNLSRWMSPLKLFEYMSVGKPIISSELPVLAEVLCDRQNALLVPPEDIDGWIAAIHNLSIYPDLRQRLGEAARRDFLANYTWDARARKVLHGL